MRQLLLTVIVILPIAVEAANLGGDGSAPTPTRGERTGTSISKEGSSPDRRGTEHQPLVVRTIPNTVPDEERERVTREREVQIANEVELNKWTAVLAVTTVFLALIALGQFLMFFFQLRLMKSGAKDTSELARSASINAAAAKLSADASQRIVEIMKDTAEKQLRAYVSVDTTKVTDAQGNEVQQIGLSVRNGGLTPAYKLQAWMTVAVRANEPTFPFEEPMQLADKGWTLLDAKEAKLMKLDYPQFSPEELAAVRANVRALYLWGEITYNDIFGVQRRTSFSYLRDSANLPVGHWLHCAHGNEAT